MAAVDFFTSFTYKWGQDGSIYNWDDAQYKQGWATIGSVPPSVEQFNRIHQLADEKANYLFAHVAQAADDAGLTMTEGSTDALSKAIRALSLPIYPTTPGSNVGPIIYVIDRQQILLWQTIGTFTGYASADVGKFVWGTSISPRPGEAHLIGQTIDRSLPQYAALVAWAQVNGHMVASGSWTKGAFHFSTLAGNNVRMPDLRDQFIRATGTDADTANARVLGARQSDKVGPLSLETKGNGQVISPAPSAGSAWWLLTGDGSWGAAWSRANNTGAETRPANVSLHPCVSL